MKSNKSSKSRLPTLGAALFAAVTPVTALAQCCVNMVTNCVPYNERATSCGQTEVMANCSSPDSYVRRYCGVASGQTGVNNYTAQCNYVCSYIDCSGEPQSYPKQILHAEASAWGSACNGSTGGGGEN
jgi:hypothetical protein